MTPARRFAFAVAALLILPAALPAAVLTPGTLYALVFDQGAGEETVVTVDPATGALTPVGPGIAGCCLIGGFPVFALDAESGGFYAAGFHLADPPGSPFRLLGFDATTGALATSPALPAGTYNPNLLKLDVGTGILHGLAFDLGASQEQVVTVDPATGALAPTGPTIADCCTVGGFNVSALDPASGRLYVAGNLLSDPPGAAKRLLGFDVATGALVSSPSLPPPWQYNDFELDPLTGTLYGIVFDLATSQESVVTVDPATAAVTPVAGGIADCCTVSSFDALDPYAGRLYILGNRLSDPPGSGPRLLGFDVAAGTLATSPFLPAGWSFNVLQVAVVPPPNQPPVALCQDAIVPADPGQCSAGASIDGGSSDPDGDPLTLSQDPLGPYPVGDTLVTLTVDDGEATDSCQATVTVVDETPPVLSCNSPATITPPQAPVSFTATAVDDCGSPAVVITAASCWKLAGNGARVHAAGCKLRVSGATIEVRNTGGVGTHVEWTLQSAGATLECEVVVANPGQG